MAVLALRKIPDPGPSGSALDVTANFAGVAASDKFKNIRGKTAILVKNANAGADSVTIDGNPDIVISVPAGEMRMIGTFDKSFEDSSGFVLVGHSVSSSVDSIVAHLGEE